MQRLPLSSLAQQKRATFPLPANTLPWFHLLLDAYATLEAGLEQQLAEDARTPACHEGCNACFTHLIPALPAEILGIRFYLNHVLTNEQRHILRAHHASNIHTTACPFLHMGSCTIYAVRTMVCRRYLVFSTPCGPTEQPERTRPADVFTPSLAHYLAALAHTFPIYQSLHLATPADSPTLPFFLKQTVLLASINWH